MSDVARTDRTWYGNWWWTVDRVSIGALLLLAVLGVILSFAASPAIALREHYASSHFVVRQLIFLGPALMMMLSLSLLQPDAIKRIAVVMLVVMIVFLAATPIIGVAVKGARRWLDFGPLRVQPSEFVKPAFVVVLAWIFAQRQRIGPLKTYVAAAALFIVVAGLLVAEPDFGQTMLVSMTAGLMVFLTGVPWFVIMALGVTGLGGIGLAYITFPHVASRIDRFLSPETGDTYQVDLARKAIENGGWFGVGAGNGHYKMRIPDAHADFVGAVGIEEFGAIAGIFLIMLFALIVLRGFKRAFGDRDPFTQLAASGLFAMFGLQAFINLGVNVHLLPAKGMTLPFISYGGSSLVAIGIGMGFALALTRRRAMARILRGKAQHGR